MIITHLDIHINTIYESLNAFFLWSKRILFKYSYYKYVLKIIEVQIIQFFDVSDLWFYVN